MLFITDGNEQTQDSTSTEYKFVTQYDLLQTSFVAKEVIEAFPTIKYFAKEILHVPYSLPAFMDNNYFKMIAHYIACNIGMFSVSGKLNLVVSSLPTLVYGGRILSYEYLSQQKQINFQSHEDKSINSPIEFIQKCGFDIVAQTTFGIISSLIQGNPAIYDITISATVGGLQCYSSYNQKDNIDQNKVLLTGEVIIPYITDTVAYYITANNMNFDTSNTEGQILAIKQGFTVLSSVVMTDYMTKLLISNIPEGYFECQNINLIGKVYGYFGGECSHSE